MIDFHANPRARRLLRCVGALALAGLLCGSLAAAASARAAKHASAPKPPAVLTLGFNDPELFSSFLPSDVAVGLANAHTAGASVWRFFISWSLVSPAQPPSLAEAADPNWSGYNWASIDATVRQIAAAGMTPLVALASAPAWAEGPDRPSTTVAPAGTWDPSASWYGAFARALATRYSGTFVDPAESPQPLPAVRDWEAWNEPNLAASLTPQWTASNQPASPAIYRALLNAFYANVKAVAPQDVVAGGTTAPFGDPPGGQRMEPVTFWRSLLCLSAGANPHSDCHQRVYMDALAHHPYPLGPPTTHAVDPGDISVPDLGKITSLVPIAERAGTLLPKGPKPLWITELSWDSNPPNPNGLPPALQAEYLEGALYVLWKQGVSLIAWWNLRDDGPTPGWTNSLASGIYYDGTTPATDVPKPSYTAFSFPFTAYRTNGIAALWGMAPAPGPVAIQVENGTTWTTAITLTAGASRIFSGPLIVGIGTNLRAVSGADTSLTWTAF
jgi:hypothetical protein